MVEHAIAISVVISIITVLSLVGLVSFVLNRTLNKFFKNVKDISKDCSETIEDLIDKFDKKFIVVHEEEEVNGVTKMYTKVSFNDTTLESNLEAKKN